MAGHEQFHLPNDIGEQPATINPLFSTVVSYPPLISLLLQSTITVVPANCDYIINYSITST